MEVAASPTLSDIWTSALGGDPARLADITITGPAHALPSTFAVTDAATAVIAAATLAAAERMYRTHGGRSEHATVDRLHAAASVTSEALVSIDGSKPATWDPLAGDYRGADGWIRLHTNYPWHRTAALRALGCEPERVAVAAEVARRSVVELESAVVEENGCAAAMRSADAWRAHPQGRAVADLPLVGMESFGQSPSRLGRTDLAPAVKSVRPDGHEQGLGALDGVRILDLTRVIAGPLASKVMAAHGADVLRIDPPGFHDVQALVADTTVGKRAAYLDITTSEGRDTLLRLVVDADVIVHGYRPGALSAVGLADEVLADACPGLIIGRLSAWGRTGPWEQRRGFDSLVQMASGIADEGMHSYDADRPRPLPCQLLDHASGWLLAAGLIRALTMRDADGSGRRVTVTLARTGRWIQDLPRTGDPQAKAPEPEQMAHMMTAMPSRLGRVSLVTCPGTVGGRAPRWVLPPTPLGDSPAAWW